MQIIRIISTIISDTKISSARKKISILNVVAFLLLCLGLVKPALGLSDALELNDSVNSYSLGPHVDYFEEVGQHYTIYSLLREVTPSPFVQSNKEIISTGPIQAIFWVRFKLRYNAMTDNLITAPTNSASSISSSAITGSPIAAAIPAQPKTAPPKSWLLKAAYSQLWDFTLYQIDHGEIIEVHSENHDTLEGIRSPHHLMQVKLTPGKEYTFYLRFRAYHGSGVNLRMITPEQFTQEAVLEQLLFGLVFGIFIAVFAYSLFNYVKYKSKLYLRYTLYVLFAGLFAASNSGHGLVYLWVNNSDISNFGMILFSYLALSCLIFFFIEFVGTVFYNQYMHRFFVVSGYSTIGMAFVTCSFIDEWVQLMSGMYGAFMMAYILGACLYYWYQGSRPAALFLASFLLLAVGATITDLSRVNFIDRSFLTEYGVYLGFISQILLLSVCMNIYTRYQHLGQIKLQRTQQFIRIAPKSKALHFDRFKHIYESRCCALFTCNMEGRVFEANPAFLRLFGFSHVANLLHDPIFIFSTLPPDVAQSLEYGFETATHQCTVIQANGKPRTLSIEFRLNYQALDGVGVLEGIVRRFNSEESEPATAMLANSNAVREPEIMNQELAVQR